MSGPLLTKSNRLRHEVEGATYAVHSVDWQEALDIPYGACVPMAVFVSAYLTEAGIESRPVEAGARFVDPFSKRYAEIDTWDGEPAMEATNAPGLPFLGHLVSYAPTFRAVFDMSLPTQTFTTLGDDAKPHCLVGQVDHTKGQVGFRSEMGRGYALYRIYPKRDGWKKRDWPFDEIREVGRRAQRESR